MQEAIAHFCENSKNGLFLLDMPTGSGKTYNVLDLIANNYNKPPYKNTKFFFITTLKKNLPIDDFRSKLNDKNEIDRVLLQISSNEDCILENLTEELEESIPQSIISSQEYKLLRNQRNLINSLSGPSKETLSNEFRKNTEPKFRKMLQHILTKEFKTLSERKRAILSNASWQWVGKLYPAAFTKDKQIFFLSIDKFLVKNTPIIESSYEFINSDLLDNAIIFIDEFDATKETILKHIICEGLSHKIDFLELFKSICSAFKTNEFHKDLLTEATTSKSIFPSLDKRFEDIRSEANQIFKKYKLQFSCRTDYVPEDQSQNFLFQDYRYLSILSDDKNFVSLLPDTVKKVNKIHFSKIKPTKEQNILPMLHDIKIFVSKFQNFTSILATNYRQLKVDRNSNSEITQEEALNSILDVFNLKEDHQKFLVSQILRNANFKKSKTEEIEIDNTIHTKGFRYYSFEDAPNHDIQSVVKMCEFDHTPEKFILQCCQKARVIGISATATLKTVVGNYDLSFLKAQLGDKMESLPKETAERIKQVCHNNWKNYEKVNIHTGLIDGAILGKCSIDVWKNIFIDKNFAERAYNKVAQSQTDEYNKSRYARICSVYKKFLVNDRIKSFLCLLTKFPKEKDGGLNLLLLQELFLYVAGDSVKDFDSKVSAKNWFDENVAVLDGYDFEKKKDEISSKLSAGKKLFVISTYQTIGAGQNLQYNIPKTLLGGLVNIDKYRTKLEKDYDGIYLDKPTHLLVNLFDGLSDEDFVK
ncbi:MAG: hypothetical protein HUK21_02985 [Fibrobacteraceae bacterium]|nr:hypothetical protein [Fibrobacteraceae bacterium]